MGQRATEIPILGISLRDRVQNEQIRRATKAEDLNALRRQNGSKSKSGD